MMSVQSRQRQMSDVAEPGAPARPRLEARRRAFMDAANSVFLEKGYASATLDDIIARSGGSRQTLYALFGGKQGLFETLVAERSASIFEAFPADELNDRPPDEVLLRLGTRFLEIVTAPDAIGFYRLVVCDNSARKEIAGLFWQQGPEKGRALLARYLAGQVRCGTLRLGDPEQAAQQLMGMLFGTLHMECLLGLRTAPSLVEIEVQVQAVVKQFLDGCRAVEKTSQR